MCVRICMVCYMSSKTPNTIHISRIARSIERKKIL